MYQNVLRVLQPEDRFGEESVVLSVHPRSGPRKRGVVTVYGSGFGKGIRVASGQRKCMVAVGTWGLLRCVVLPGSRGVGVIGKVGEKTSFFHGADYY